MSTHTPGPWTAHALTGKPWIEGPAPDHLHVAAVDSDEDARLIAAAPRMLVHLRTFLTTPSGVSICACRNINAVNAGVEKPCWYCEARAILRDVEGESND